MPLSGPEFTHPQYLIYYVRKFLCVGTEASVKGLARKRGRVVTKLSQSTVASAIVLVLVLVVLVSLLVR